MGRRLNFKKLWTKRRELGFTFLAVPNSGGQPRRLHLPLSLLFAILAFVVVLTGANIYVWFAYPAQIHRIGSLRNEISRRDAVIDRLDHENKQIQPSIERSLQQARHLEKIQLLEAEAQSLIETVRKKSGRPSGSSRGIILRNRLYDNLKTDVQAQDGKDSRLATLDRNLDVLDKQLDERERTLKSAVASLKEANRRLDHTPSIWPIPPRVTSRFGSRRDPFTGGYDYHGGVDLKAYRGQPVKACAAGRVIFAGWQNGYGWKVEIDHGYGYHTVYAHNDRLAVSVGQIVSKGQVISYAGSSGRSTAPHVHLEVKYFGTKINPVAALSR